MIVVSFVCGWDQSPLLLRRARQSDEKILMKILTLLNVPGGQSVQVELAPPSVGKNVPAGQLTQAEESVCPFVQKPTGQAVLSPPSGHCMSEFHGDGDLKLSGGKGATVVCLGTAKWGVLPSCEIRLDSRGRDDIDPAAD